MTQKSLLSGIIAVLISVAFTSSAFAGGNVRTLIVTNFNQNLILAGRDIKTGNSELHGSAAGTVRDLRRGLALVVVHPAIESSRLREPGTRP